MFLVGGPAEAGGYNVAGRFGEMILVDTFSFRHPLAKNELTQAFSLPFPSTEDTIYWEFGYVASDSSLIDTIYSVGLSLVWDTIPDALDRWNFGPKFPLTIMPVTAVESEGNGLPDNFSLSQNYPNPFNPSTSIRYAVTDRQFVSLNIYDVTGKKISTIVNEEKGAGNYQVVFNASQYPSGVYFYRLQAGNFVETKKMILLR